jgi:predicted thioredoxin/glutaredoxin
MAIATNYCISCIKQLPIAMVMINITTKQNCGNSNKLLHRLGNLITIHGLAIAMVMINITTNQNCGNRNKLLHRLGNLVAMHGLYLLQWS